VVANVKVGDQVQTMLIGAADKKGGTSSGIQAQVGFTLKPQKRTRVYWRTEGAN